MAIRLKIKTLFCLMCMMFLFFLNTDLLNAQQSEEALFKDLQWRNIGPANMSGRVTDYQMSAWLMAVWLNGLDEAETVSLTEALLHSGSVLRLPSVELPKVDKHSTGGVGDKISLCLGPLVACSASPFPWSPEGGSGTPGGPSTSSRASKAIRPA